METEMGLGFAIQQSSNISSQRRRLGCLHFGNPTISKFIPCLTWRSSRQLPAAAYLVSLGHEKITQWQQLPSSVALPVRWKSSLGPTVTPTILTRVARRSTPTIPTREFSCAPVTMCRTPVLLALRKWKSILIFLIVCARSVLNKHLSRQQNLMEDNARDAITVGF